MMIARRSRLACSHFAKLVVAVAVLLAGPPSCFIFLGVDAHRPLLQRPSCDGDFSSVSSALVIPDPEISWSFKHYADCTSRAIWMAFTNPSEDFRFYVGIGVPTQPRFADLRADALIAGPGLPALSADDLASLPAAVRDEYAALEASHAAENGPSDPRGFGALLHRSPADQSSCAHLGAVMQRSSTVREGRCDFYEPYGRTNSWRVLDADGNVIPVAGARYHVAVWLQEHVSGKFGVAVGTWREDFSSRFSIEAPGCARADLGDFSEQHTGTSDS